jgi:hypothetical protein
MILIVLGNSKIKRMKRSVLFFAMLFMGLMCRAGEDDPLHDRVFNTSMSETKNGVVAKKVIADLVRFKNGRIESVFLKKKFGFRHIRYRINKDSAYVDETGADVRLLVAEAVATDESNITVQIQFTVLEWDIDGVIRITKNDRLRRYYDLAGREKGGKPEKEKRNKRDHRDNDIKL